MLTLQPFSNKCFAPVYSAKSPKQQSNRSVLNRDISCTPLKAELLNSKFNINFKGVKSSPEISSDNLFLAEFSLRFFEKMQNMLKGNNSENNSCAIKSARDIDLLSEQFKKDNLTGIYSSGLSLNAAVDYLCAKRQIDMPDSYDGFAFMIDRLAIEYFKSLKTNSMEYKKLQYCLGIGTVKLYCLAQNEDEAKKLIDEMNEIIEFDKNKVTVLLNSPDTNYVNCPKADEIAKTIRTLARFEFADNTSECAKFEKAICKYLDESFLAFSYQSLADASKEQYALIENIVKSKGKTMDDVEYLIPMRLKSYDMINYIYASVNNISADKFKYLKNLREKGASSLDENKVYVVLDDVSASSDSFTAFMAENSLLFREAGNLDLIFSPIVATHYAAHLIESKKEGYENSHQISLAFAPLRLFRDFRYVEENFQDKSSGVIDMNISLGYIDDDDAIELFSPDSAPEIPKSQIEDYFKGFSFLNREDVEYLRKNLLEGCGGIYLAIAFPYMIPDNSSDITALLGGYFLNKDIPKANRAVDDFADIPQGVRMSLKKYLFLKSKIRNFGS